MIVVSELASDGLPESTEFVCGVDDVSIAVQSFPSQYLRAHSFPVSWRVEVLYPVRTIVRSYGDQPQHSLRFW